jgi:hypothetical protein
VPFPNRLIRITRVTDAELLIDGEKPSFQRQQDAPFQTRTFFELLFFKTLPKRLDKASNKILDFILAGAIFWRLKDILEQLPHPH